MEAIAYNIEVVDQILLQLVHKFGIALPEQVGIAATVLADSCTHLQVEFCYGDEIYDQRVARCCGRGQGKWHGLNGCDARDRGKLGVC